MIVARSMSVFAACAILSLAANLFGATSTVAPYLVFFVIGIVSASSGWKPGPRLAVTSLLSSLLFVFICATGPFRDVILGGAHPGPLYVFNRDACVLISLVMVPWAIYTTCQKSTKLDRMYGDLSFVVYLLHWSIIGAMIAGKGSYVQRGVSIAEALAIVMVSSLVIWRVFDYPINQLRSKWVKKRLDINTGRVTPVIA
jgi:peptidoglycan/LPS O-acetylase OafA/YrhL